MKSAFYDTSINVRFKSCKNIGHQWQYIDNGNDDRLGLTNSHNVALRQCYPWNKSWRTCQIEKEIEREKEREKKRFDLLELFMIADDTEWLDALLSTCHLDRTV